MCIDQASVFPGSEEKAVLTDMEIKVLELISQDKRRKEIAAELYISGKTVTNHISSILDKLQVRSRVGAIMKGIELPLFYGIAYDSGSQAATLEGGISAMGYASSCWALLGFTGFADILFVILAVFFFGKEKDDGQIKFIILRNCNRSQVFFAKYLSAVFLIVLSYMAMYVTAVGVCYIWIARSTRNTFFCSGLQELIWNITSDALIVIQVIMVVNIVIALCMYRKSFFCTLAGIVISLL